MSKMKVNLNKTKFHIAVDMDDVCLDFVNSVMDTFYREYGVYPDYDGQSWGKKAVAFYTHPLFRESGYKSWWEWLKDRDWLWSTFPAVPGAIGGIKRLRESGHYVECVTSKPEWAEFNVWKWLGKWRPAFHRVTIVNSDRKERKVDATEARLIIDDKLETCLEFVAAGRRAIWFNPSKVQDQWFNVPITDRLVQVWTWDDIIHAVDNFWEAECTSSESTQATA